MIDNCFKTNPTHTCLVSSKISPSLVRFAELLGAFFLLKYLSSMLAGTLTLEMSIFSDVVTIRCWGTRLTGQPFSLYGPVNRHGDETITKYANPQQT